MFRWELFVLLIATVLAIQVLANFADEYGDLQKGADTEERVGPKRAMQRGEISFARMRGALIIMTLVSLALGVALVLTALGLDPLRLAIFVALGVFALFAAIGYTVGRRAYGYRGLADLFCLVCFGPLVVCGAYYLYAHTVTPGSILAGLGIGLLVCGMLNLNNMRDRETDAKTGKITLVVRLGARAALIYHRLLLISGVLCLAAAGLVCIAMGDVGGVGAGGAGAVAAAGAGAVGAGADAADAAGAVGAGAAAPPAAAAAGAPALAHLGWWRLAYLLACIPLIAQLRTVGKVSEPAAYDGLMRPYSLYVIVASVLFAFCVGV
jgi:1,4-dihydroxy-2-naphthoate octaprenyltransferase